MSVTAFNRRRRELMAKIRGEAASVKTETPDVSDAPDGAGKPVKPKRPKGGDRDAGD